MNCHHVLGGLILILLRISFEMPLIDQDQFNKVMSYIKAGRESGAKLVTGGDQIGTKGFYIMPTIFLEVKVWE